METVKVFAVLLVLFSISTLLTVQSSSTPAANAAATVSWIDIPTPNSEPTSIVNIPGGFAFTERQGNKIGVFTCATPAENCSLTEFPVPTPQSEPSDIAFGLANPTISSTDLAIWFTESASKKIGRLLQAQQSAIQESDLKLAGRPRFVSVARDNSSQLPSGDVWFTESPSWSTEPPFDQYQSGAIWRINPTTLAATRYAIPKSYAAPWGIAVDPDHTVWVKDGQDLLKVSEASGVVAVYPIPWGTNDRIAVDARSGVQNGRVWLTGSSYPDSYLVSFDPSTLQFTRIGIGGFQGADNIEVDDSGNVWFASWMTGQIATFRP
jgi:streptogramin lyase